MATTLRARLSLWNATAFAVLLGGFAAGTYAFVVSTTERRTDGYLRQTAAALAEALVEAHAAEGAPPDGAPGAAPVPLDSARVAAVVRRFRFHDIGVGVFDATPPRLAAGAPDAPAPRAPRPLATTRQDAAPRARGGRPASAAGGGTYPYGGPWGLTGTRPLVARAVREGTVTATIGEGAAAERVVATALPLGGRVLVVSATQSLGDQQAILQQAREALIAGVIFTLVVASAGGYAVTWWSLRPIAVMSRRAARIEAGTLHERLPVRDDVVELSRLAAAFNGLLERLQRTFDQQRQFLADASHELRTPVAIVRGEAEYALAQAERPADEYRAAFATVRTQAEGLARLVDDLFLLARASATANAGEQGIAREPLYLEELCEACVRSVRTLAATKGVAIRFVPDAELPVLGDERLLRRMLVNLLDNAIKYTPTGGAVRVRAERVTAGDDAPPADARPADAAEAVDPSAERVLRHVLAERWTGEWQAVTAEHALGGGAPTAEHALVNVPPDGQALAAAGTRPAGAHLRLLVEDTGPGIPPAAQPHVFERFYRARQVSGGPGDASGAGLGLAIVAWVAAAHGGRVALARSDERGTTFAVELPLAAPPGVADEALSHATPDAPADAAPRDA